MLDVVPPLAVGALLTAVLLLQREFDLLFGVWMCMFGLTNLAARYVLPPQVCLVGLFYIAAGVLCFFWPGVGLQNPWPMGLVFFAGEWVSGMILYVDRRRYATLSHYADKETEA